LGLDLEELAISKTVLLIKRCEVINKYAWFKESREAECTVSGFIGFEQKASIKVKIEAGGTIFAEHKGVGSPED